MYPFERFNEDAKRSLTFAQEEAESARHTYIGTEHLLLGLLRVEQGTAHRVLTGLGVQIDSVREVVKSVIGRNERILIQHMIPTSRVKKVIELSFEEARRMRRNEVDTGDLLMGLILEGEGIAAKVLQDLGATEAATRQAVERELTAPTSDPLKASRPGPPYGVGSLRRMAPRRSEIELYASDATRLSSLLKAPAVAKLLRAKGVDIEALSKQLADPPPKIEDLRAKLAIANHALEGTVETQDFEVAAKLRDEIDQMAGSLAKAEQEWLDSLA
jgi:ATP-dependent Clp protease ATP-binding subunit ClpC